MTARLLLSRFNQGRNGAPAIRHSPVRPVGVNLISFLFGFFEICREDDAAAGAVGFHRVCERSGVWNLENGLEHFDDILERVLLIIQNDDVIEPAQLVFCSLIDICV